MTSSEHSEIVRRESEGSVAIGIDRATARKFFTDHSIKEIAELTGESPYLEKLIVFACLFDGPIALLMSWSFAVRLFGWWAALAIPVLGSIWIVNYARSSNGNSRAGLFSTMLMGSIALIWLMPSFNNYLPLMLAVIGSLWLTRMVYVTSAFFLRAFVIRNHRAFDHLTDFIIIKEL